MSDVKVYCESCGNFQPALIEALCPDELNQQNWGDVVCATCHPVICTLVAPEPGQYTFVKQPDA